ncbi:MAG: hypothetical protein AAB092_09460 [Chloroflexota bacterium]
MRREFDIERAFLDRQQIVVPARFAAESIDLARLDEALGAAKTTPANLPIGPTLRVTDIEVPADGIHLEVAAGTCILAGVPPLPDGSSES